MNNVFCQKAFYCIRFTVLFNLTKYKLKVNFLSLFYYCLAVQWFSNTDYNKICRESVGGKNFKIEINKKQKNCVGVIGQ